MSNSIFDLFKDNLDLSPEEFGAFAHGFDERLQGIEEQLGTLQGHVATLRKHLAV